MNPGIQDHPKQNVLVVVASLSDLMHFSLSPLHSDYHCSVGASQPVCIYCPGAMGRAAGSLVLSYLLGRAGDRMGQHHGLSNNCAGTHCLWSGYGQPASGQAQ